MLKSYLTKELEYTKLLQHYLHVDNNDVINNNYTNNKLNINNFISTSLNKFFYPDSNEKNIKILSKIKNKFFISNLCRELKTIFYIIDNSDKESIINIKNPIKIYSLNHIKINYKYKNESVKYYIVGLKYENYKIKAMLYYHIETEKFFLRDKNVISEINKSVDIEKLYSLQHIFESLIENNNLYFT